MRAMIRLKRIYILGLLPVSFLLILSAKKSSYFAEKIFARYIYKWISQIFSTIIGVLPFSLAELLLFLLPALTIVVILRFIIRLIRNKEDRKLRLVKAALNVLCTVSIILFLFTIMGGLNYYRYSFSYYSKLQIEKSRVEELYALTENLALQANKLRAEIPATDEEGVFKLSVGNRELAKMADRAMKMLADEYPVLGGSYGAPKPVLLSSAMSYTEITGIFVPFTMEANVNVDVPDYTIPATMLHELAHMRGFMREDEANFIAYLAGMESDSIELNYSSTMMALVMSGNALYREDPELYFKVRDQYDESVIRDIRANSAYWVKYEDTVISTVSNKINDTYLKANSQTDGVKSYGRMMDLLLAKYRKEQAETSVELEQTETSVELEQTETSVELEKTETNVEIELSDTNVE